LITHSRKKYVITETESRDNSFNQACAGVTFPNDGETMTQGGQIQQEASRPMKRLLHPKNITKIGNWNVRTLLESGNIAQAAREMAKREIDIMGISETHWIGHGKLQLQEGETIIYSGREDNIHRQGVGILMSRNTSRALIDWSPISERIIQARFYSNYIKLTLVHVYAPTEDAEEQVKDEFYTRLQDVLSSCRTHDMLIVTGDMNAKVGNNNTSFERVMGKHGLGQRNNNGERLCEICDMNELMITGTLFPHKTIHKATWTSPDGVTKNQIDHILINRKFRNSVEDTRVFRSADIGSDHFLMCMKVKLRLKTNPKDERRARVKYDITKLKYEDIRKTFTIALENRYEVLKEEVMEQVEEHTEGDIEREFNIMMRAHTETAETVLGKPRKRKKPWISDVSWKLVEEREEINKKILGTRSERVKTKLRKKYAEKKSEVKKSIRKDKRMWLDGIAEEAEKAAGSQHMKTLYGLTKTLCNERTKRSSEVQDKDGNLLSSKEDIQARWTEHFQEILNREAPSNPITEEEDGGDEFTDITEEIETNEPTMGEVKVAIRRLKNGKAAGTDSITAELLKAGGEFSARKMHELLNRIWEYEKIPGSWRQGLIIKLPKKGNLKECKNSRGITLLSVAGKILGRIIIDRIRNGVDKKLRMEQAGYRSGRGTTEQVFVLRNILEQVNEWQATLYLGFVDFEKAFDSIHRESLWIIMRKYGIPEKLVRMIRLFYDGFQCAVEDDGEPGEWFEVTTGVKQGCNMSGFLFLIVLDWVMKRTVGGGENGIRWKFTSKLDDLDFADDIALLSSTKHQMQCKLNRLNAEAGRVGLKINAQKTKMMRINQNSQEPFTIGAQGRIEDVEEFTYLGAIVCKDGGGMKDLKNRLSKARGAFIRLKKIWRSSNISRKTKLRLYKTLVVPVLVYGCETWKMNQRDSKMIDVFNNKCLRRILKVHWEEHVSTEELLERARSRPLSNEVKRRRWKMIGHILRQDRNNITNVAMTWAPEGRRKRGRPKTTWRRTVEKERSEAGWRSWEEVRVAAADRKKWRVTADALCAT